MKPNIEKEEAKIKKMVQDKLALTKGMMSHEIINRTATQVRLGMPMSTALHKILRYFGINRYEKAIVKTN